MKMERPVVQLIDLPDELLVMIFRKVNNVELLYSLMGINTRLNRIISDQIFTRYLTLFRSFSNRHICPLVDTVLDRFCSQILPEIHNKINILHLESSSMVGILQAADYPNLHSLGLYNLDEFDAERIFTDKSLLDIFNKKIESLVIEMTNNENKRLRNRFLTTIFTKILTIFVNLRSLNCHPFLEFRRSRLSFGEEIPTCFSSTLMDLHINVAEFDDCLYLLDGRFNQLRRLYVSTSYVDPRSPMLNEKKLLCNLKCFSLMCEAEIYYYKNSILALIQRMMNLEELSLYVCINDPTVIDGNILKNDIIEHLPKLNKFIFNIRSLFRGSNPIDFTSYEQILTGLEKNQVIYYVDYFSEKRHGQCHFYTYPYTLRYFDGVTNLFPNGLFECVREVSLFDERPFEHQFFIRIAQAFPLLEKLSLTNETPQKQKSINNDTHLPIIEYPHLIELDFNGVHDDYIEQFLLDTKMFLPNNIRLYLEYEDIKRVTQNFTLDTMRVNCTKMKHVYFHNRFHISPDLTNYFPHANISSSYCI